MKYAPVLFMFIAGAWSIALPAPSNELTIKDLAALDGVRVIKYDGPRYEMTAEDKAALRHAHATNGTFKRPKGMPDIILEPGTILDFGDGINSTLSKRSGNRWIGAFGGYGCSTNTFLASVTNFGCGTGCISTSGLSGQIQQQDQANSYPTMDVWSSGGCSGSPMQHFGVEETNSCTNANNCCGYHSFIGYFDC